MENAITHITPPKVVYPPRPPKPRLIPRNLQAHGRRDIVTIGGHGPVSTKQAMNMVLERTFEKLRGVVAEARQALGIPEGAVIDTSPEATATRIADFALGWYDNWRANHEELVEEDARKQFAGFIGGAISQGIEEARGILTALEALTPHVGTDINTTWGLIQERLADFVENGL